MSWKIKGELTLQPNFENCMIQNYTKMYIFYLCLAFSLFKWVFKAVELKKAFELFCQCKLSTQQENLGQQWMGSSYPKQVAFLKASLKYVIF